MVAKPSEIVLAWVAAERAASRVGEHAILQERKLEAMGFCQVQIDEIFKEIEFLTEQERVQKVRLARLDAIVSTRRRAS